MARRHPGVILGEVGRLDEPPVTILYTPPPAQLEEPVLPARCGAGTGCSWRRRDQLIGGGSPVGAGAPGEEEVRAELQVPGGAR